jgi:transposase-like protein
MMPKTKAAGTQKAWPEHMIARACELRETGKTVAQISRRLGMPPSTVDWHCIKRGAEPPKIRQFNYTPRTFVRNGSPVNPFTPEQDATILAMATAGDGHTKIGAALGRNPSSIRNRLLILARHELRAEMAQAAA